MLASNSVLCTIGRYIACLAPCVREHNAFSFCMTGELTQASCSLSYLYHSHS